MRHLKLLSCLCCVLFLFAFQCETEPVHNGDPVYIEFVTSDTLNFDQVYAHGKPDLYHDLQYVYDKDGSISQALSLPLSAFQDSVIYIFRQEDELDTVVIRYEQEVVYYSNHERYVNAFKDYKVAYSTFKNVQICESCYLNF